MCVHKEPLSTPRADTAPYLPPTRTTTSKTTTLSPGVDHVWLSTNTKKGPPGRGSTSTQPVHVLLRLFLH
uniref:Uncharacterized protein n=1 Tax=Panagrellus redivivus TaxID=6233 RepID=A0A7E4V549_PANRE